MATDVIEVIQGPAPTIEVVIGAPGPVGPQGPPGPAAPSSSVFFYRVDANSQAATDPGPGKIRFNSGVQANATALYVDWLTEDDFDAHVFFKTSAAASQIVIQDADLADTYQVWKVTGIVESTDWFTVQMTFVSQSGPGGVATFPHNARVGVIIETVGVPGPPGPPGPAGAGDVNGPASATDNAIAVFSGTTGKLVKDALGAAALGRIEALVVGTAIPANTGGIRLPNSGNSPGGYINARNIANDGDIEIAQVYSDNKLYLGNTAAGMVLRPAGPVVVSSSVAIGTNPAQSGALRLGHLDAIMMRNGGNTIDIRALVSYNDTLYLATGATSLSVDCQNIGLGTASAAIVFLPGSISIAEKSAPAAPAVNQANVWLQDNGAGKSQLMVQFATGAPIAIATQA